MLRQPHAQVTARQDALALQFRQSRGGNGPRCQLRRLRPHVRQRHPQPVAIALIEDFEQAREPRAQVPPDARVYIARRLLARVEHQRLVSLNQFRQRRRDLLFVAPQSAGEFGGGHRAGGRLQQLLCHDLQHVSFQPRQPRQRPLVEALMAGGIGVEDNAAADGAQRRESADDEAILRNRDGRRLQRELHGRRFAGQQPLAVQQRQARDDLVGTQMQAQAGAVFDLPRLGQQRQLRVQAIGGGERPGRGGGLAAAQLFFLQLRQVKCRALADFGLGGLLAVYLDAADPAGEAVREDLDLVADLDLARQHCARDDCAKALHREHAVDGHAEDAAVTAGLGLGCQRVQRAAQVLEARAGDGRDGNEGRTVQEAARHIGLDVCNRRREPLGVNQIRLRDGDQAMLHAQQLQDLEMLARLRRQAFVGGDDEHRRIEVRGACHHRPHQALVAGDVDEDDLAVLILISSHEDKAEFDGDPPALLLGQRVGVNAGQGLDESGLAVVDMPGRADDDLSRLGHVRY